MRNPYASDDSDSDHDIDRDLSKRLEREGGYTSRRAPTLDERGTVKVGHKPWTVSTLNKALKEDPYAYAKSPSGPPEVIPPIEHESDCICDACWGRR